MLAFYENARSQLTKNSAHNSGKCSQLANMLTTYRNAHNSEKCSQLVNMLTTCRNAHNRLEMLTILPPNVERSQHSTPANAPSLPSV